MSATTTVECLLQSLNACEDVSPRLLKLWTDGDLVYVWETWDGEGFKWVSGTWEEWDNDPHACTP